MPWQRRSFQDFPDALVQYLDQGLETDNAQRISMENVTVGNWVKKFVDYETSPRSGKNANKNKPYSLGTQQGFPEVPILSILSKVTPEASKILGCTL
jgi:hypothetical protein